MSGGVVAHGVGSKGSRGRRFRGSHSIYQGVSHTRTVSQAIEVYSFG